MFTFYQLISSPLLPNKQLIIKKNCKFFFLSFSIRLEGIHVDKKSNPLQSCAQMLETCVKGSPRQWNGFTLTCPFLSIASCSIKRDNVIHFSWCNALINIYHEGGNGEEVGHLKKHLVSRTKQVSVKLAPELG